jgi:murein lipoprotein
VPQRLTVVAGPCSYPPLTRADARPDRKAVAGTSTLDFQLFRGANNWKNAMSLPLTKLAPTVMILAGAMSLGACASKSFVREQIAPVSERVATLETRLQETDSTAKSALAEAQAASGQAQNNAQRLEQINGRVDSVEQRMAAQERRPKRPRN